MINTESVDTIIGSRIRQGRKLLGLTLRDLGRLADLSISFLSDVENGKRGISAENLLAIARALDVTPDWFFKPLLDRDRRGQGRGCSIDTALRFARDLDREHRDCAERMRAAEEGGDGGGDPIEAEVDDIIGGHIGRGKGGAR